MKRFGLFALPIAAIAVIGSAQLITGTAPLQAAVRPTPTPTPVAIQYDEITRAYEPPTSPAPPGAFHADYTAIMAAAPPADSVAAAATPSPSPTPAPRKHGMFGSLGSIASIATGHIPSGYGDNGSQGSGGSTASGIDTNAAYAQAMGRANAMRYGTLVRYTYYWRENWVRIDDPVARTATIEKCNLHQFITLNLARKTYTITDTQPQSLCNPAPQQPMGPQHPGAVENSAPGTQDLTIDNGRSDLGRLTIDGIATTGASTTMSMAMANSTGSCHNASFEMSKVVYVSRIGKQRAYCPLPAAGSSAPADPTSMLMHGGCKPTMHGTMAGFSDGDSKYLEMYMLTSAGIGNGQHFDNLTERGNVRWFYKPEADALFSIPPDFTKATQ